MKTHMYNVPGWEKIPEKYRRHFSPSTLKDLAKFPTDWPEIRLTPIAAASVATNDSANYMSIFVSLLTTTSRGNVTIKSTDTSDNPLVNLNWLATETDQQLAVAAFKRARETAQATGIVVGPEFAPGPTVQTDEQILAYIRQSVSINAHAVATFRCLTSRGKNPQLVSIHSHVHQLLAAAVTDHILGQPRRHGQKGRSKRRRRLARSGLWRARAPNHRLERVANPSARTDTSHCL